MVSMISLLFHFTCMHTEEEYEQPALGPIGGFLRRFNLVTQQTREKAENGDDQDLPPPRR